MAGNNVKEEGGADGVNPVKPVTTKEDHIGIQPTGLAGFSLADLRLKNTCVSVLLVIKVFFVATVIVVGLTLAYQILSDKDEYKQLEEKYNRLVSANGTLTDTYTTMILPHKARDVAPTDGGHDVMSTTAAMTSSFTSTAYFTNTGTVFVTVTSTPSAASIPAAAVSSSISDLDASAFSATYCEGGSIYTVLVTVPSTPTTGLGGSSETSTLTGIPQEVTPSLTTIVVTQYTTETIITNGVQTVITTMDVSSETSAVDGIIGSSSASSDIFSDGWVTPTPAAASSGPFTNSTGIPGTNYNFTSVSVPVSVSMFTVSWILTVHPSGSGVGPSAGGAASASSLVPVVSKGSKSKPGGPKSDKGITGGYCVVMLVALITTILI